MSVLQLCRFQGLRPPFSSLLTWCALSKGFSCSWKRCYGCLEQKIKDHLLFIKHNFRTWGSQQRDVFMCVLFSAALFAVSKDTPCTQGQTESPSCSHSLSFPLLLALPSLPTHLPFSYCPLTTILCSWPNQKRILLYIKSTVPPECFVVVPCVCLWTVIWPTDLTGLVLPEDMFVILGNLFPMENRSGQWTYFFKRWIF